MSNYRIRCAGYARPPLGVSADMLSAVKKCPNHFMLWGFANPLRRICPSPVRRPGGFAIRRQKMT